jgi:hypothetical protein
LAGKRWLSAAEDLAALASRYPLAALVGRAGMGKSQVLLHLCKDSCIYIDATELQERSLAQIAAAVAWRLAPRLRGRIAEAYRSYGYSGLLSLAQADPSWVLSEALSQQGARLIVAIDEFIPSAEDPDFFRAAAALHRLRNLAPRSAGFIFSFLPEVYEKLAEKIPPLGNILSSVVVQLPDVLDEDDVLEIANHYCPERAKEALAIWRARPDITVRELLMALSSPAKAVEVPIS